MELLVNSKLKLERSDFEAFLAAIRAIQAEVASWPSTGLKADKAFFDELSEEPHGDLSLTDVRRA